MANNDNDQTGSRSSSSLDGISSMATASQLAVSNSRLGLGYSLSDCELLDETAVITEIQQIEPTAAILDYCKRMFRRPFVCILGIVGLMPMSVDPDWASCIGHIQTFFILGFLLLGYVLQFVCGFRRDRGFVSHVPSGPTMETSYDLQHYFRFKRFFDSGEIAFIYIFPAFLHFGAFVSAIFVYRIVDNERIQSLIERVFLLSNTPKVLVRKLWLYFFLGLCWLLCSTAYVIVRGLSHTMVKNSYITVTSPAADRVRVLLYVSLFCQDTIQVVIICTYSLSCYLLRQYLVHLKQKLLHRELEPLDWMREICEFRRFLQHLNVRLSVPVCFLTLLNTSYTFASISNLFRDSDACPLKIISLSLANILLWFVLAIVPFVQAAALTVTCRETQDVGHLICIRPFVHRNTSAQDLHTVLLYASSLKMNAKLFRIPINVHYICFVMFCGIIFMLTFGMCLNISIGLY